jgi:hypothetical protein
VQHAGAAVVGHHAKQPLSIVKEPEWRGGMPILLANSKQVENRR